VPTEPPTGRGERAGCSKRGGDPEWFGKKKKIYDVGPNLLKKAEVHCSCGEK